MQDHSPITIEGLDVGDDEQAKARHRASEGATRVTGSTQDTSIPSQNPLLALADAAMSKSADGHVMQHRAQRGSSPHRRDHEPYQRSQQEQSMHDIPAFSHEIPSSPRRSDSEGSKGTTTTNTDDERPLSISSSSPPARPAPSPRPPVHEAQGYTRAELPTIDKPKLARVSSDPVAANPHHHLSQSSNRFQPQKSNRDFANRSSNHTWGNRPAGVPLPGSHSQSQQGQPLPSSFSALHGGLIASSSSSSHQQPRGAPARYPDPDSHWLSEDEGDSFNSDVRAAVQQPRRRDLAAIERRFPNHAPPPHHPPFHSRMKSSTSPAQGDVDGASEAEEDAPKDGAIAKPANLQTEHRAHRQAAGAQHRKPSTTTTVHLDQHSNDVYTTSPHQPHHHHDPSMLDAPDATITASTPPVSHHQHHFQQQQQQQQLPQPAYVSQRQQQQGSSMPPMVQGMGMAGVQPMPRPISLPAQHAQPQSAQAQAQGQASTLSPAPAHALSNSNLAMNSLPQRSTGSAAAATPDPMAAYRDYAPFIKDLSAITPALVKALSCPGCGKLMQDPMTLACGHSKCMACLPADKEKLVYHQQNHTDPAIVPGNQAIAAARMDIPDLPEAPFVEMSDHHQRENREVSPSGVTLSPKNIVRPILADATCAVPACRKTTKASPNRRQNGLRVDVVLQNIAILLRTHVASSPKASGSGLSGNGNSGKTKASRAPLHAQDSWEDAGTVSEPAYLTHAGRASPNPGLSRSRSTSRAPVFGAPSTSHTLSGGGHDSLNVDIPSTSYLRPGTEADRSSTNSSPDEETKSDDNAKRAMKSRRGSATRGLKKSRGAGESPAFGGSSTTGALSPSSVKISSEAHDALPYLVTDVINELECHICVTLIYEPLTTPCGHTFCKRCLLRSLDHSNRCPLCRSELPGIGFFLSAPLNQTLSGLMLTTFPLLYEQRKELSKQEEEDSGLDTPIFVCMVSFPSMPTNLHIYEPRYRLMMRRAVESNKRFGMVLPSRTAGSGGFAQYGTMLEIKNMHTFDDGRSMIETIGVHRFKILESGTMDGYTVGRIERFDDIGDEEEAELERLALARFANRQAAERQQAAAASQPMQEKSASAQVPQQQGQSQAPQMSPQLSQSRPNTGLRRFSFNRSRSASNANANASGNNDGQGVPTPQLQNPSVPAAGLPAHANPNDAAATDAVELTNAQLIDVCKNFVDALRNGSTPWLLQRLNSSLPPMPEDPREFTWWMAMLMPVDDHEKARLLQITSYRLRLRLLVFWIQQMQHSWWFNRGCTVS